MSTIRVTNVKHESSASNNITLDSSGNLAVQAGSASTPAIQATGDSNTGIFFPAADTIAFAEGGAEAVRIDSSANLKFNSGYGSVATAYGCRAWIIFDGTSASIGTGYGSANVTSVTDAGTGRYVVNFTNAMPDTNFSTLATCRHNEGTAPGFVSFARNDGYQRSTGATDELRVHTTSATYDSDPVCVAVFR